MDILTIGQYLSPGKDYLPIKRYYTPEEFDRFIEIGKEMGFKWVESGPMVRSSYRADEQVRKLSKLNYINFRSEPTETTRTDSSVLAAGD